MGCCSSKTIKKQNSLTMLYNKNTTINPLYSCEEEKEQKPKLNRKSKEDYRIAAKEMLEDLDHYLEHL